jgi:exonuclease III
MRIDYFIVSEKLKEKIVACEMHGKGIELQGKFLFL